MSQEAIREINFLSSRRESKGRCAVVVKEVEVVVVMVVFKVVLALFRQTLSKEKRSA